MSLACDTMIIFSALPLGLGLLVTVPIHAVCKAIVYQNLSTWTPRVSNQMYVAPIADPHN